MFDLTEFLVERGASDIGSFFSIIAVHEDIFVDEVALRHFYYFYGYDERDGYHGVDENKVGEKADDSVSGSSVIEGDVGGGGAVVGIEESC
jgi:hypothetical protein